MFILYVEDCHCACTWDESALKALLGVKWAPDAIYIILFFQLHFALYFMGFRLNIWLFLYISFFLQMHYITIFFYFTLHYILWDIVGFRLNIWLFLYLYFYIYSRRNVSFYFVYFTLQICCQEKGHFACPHI